MAEFEVIAEVADMSKARVLLAALRAHGFTPLESGTDGLPGLPGAIGPRGIPIRVPLDEARDAAILARSLLDDMDAMP